MTEKSIDKQKLKQQIKNNESKIKRKAKSIEKAMVASNAKKTSHL